MDRVNIRVWSGCRQSDHKANVGKGEKKALKMSNQTNEANVRNNDTEIFEAAVG